MPESSTQRRIRAAMTGDRAPDLTKLPGRSEGCGRAPGGAQDGAPGPVRQASPGRPPGEAAAPSPATPGGGAAPGWLRGPAASPQMATEAHCLRCEWTETGDAARTDKAAEKHTAAGHPTATVTSRTTTLPDAA